jgi:hypothetical protein
MTDVVSGAVMGAETEAFLTEIKPIGESPDHAMSRGERVIRIGLLTGFITVLAVEIWLLLQALHILN